MLLGWGIDGGEECSRDDWVSNGLRRSGEDNRRTRSDEWAHEDARLHMGGGGGEETQRRETASRELA